jgi:hypothetical protein
LIPPMLMFVIGMEKKKEIVPVAAEAPQPQEPTVLPI